MGAAGSKLEKVLGDQFPEGERYFGLENFGNTCYCNSVLQDQIIGQMIGIECESQRLYHLTMPTSPKVCITSTSSAMLYHRLGYPNLHKLQQIVPSLSSLESLECESC